MPHPRDDLPKLFRSLGPDDSDFQVNSNASAREVEQRWPLFKAMSPEKAAPPPALTEEERQRWTAQGQSNSGRGTPALTLPGLAGKLASSLGKMSGRMVPDTTGPIAVKRAGPSNPSVTPVRSIRPPQKKTQAESRGNLASLPAQAGSVPHESPAGMGLFETAGATEIAATRREVADAPADTSLMGVFGRLESAEKEKVIASPIAKRSSFLGRLGRR